ncbi:MAG TPA: phage tail protein [Allosphingosinicella sp.]|nr:phage tail protein [Allosphingosinicella sp.]
MGRTVKAVVGIGLAVVGVVTANPGLIVMGVSMTASALLTPKVKQGQRQASVTNLTIGEIAREAVLGEAVTGGSLADAFNYGGKYGTDWEVLVIALADHECDSLVGFYVNDQYVAFTGDGMVAGYNNQLAIYFRHGTESQTAPAILAANGPGWTADDRGVGICYVVAAYKADASDAQNPIYPAGRPAFRWRLKGAKCYVARLDSTVAGGSGPHRRNTPSTWTWTANLIDCRYSWVRGIYACNRVTDPTMLLIGRGLSAVEAPPENTFAPANLCDEVVDGEPRYKIGGVIRADEIFINVEEMFAAACGGVIVQPEGSVEIEPGQAKAAVAYITDDDLVVGSSVDYSEFLPRSDDEWFNTVVPRYVEPAQNWADHGAPIRRLDADVIADGGPREEVLNLPLVTSGKQAGRVGEIRRRFGRLWKRAGITLGPPHAELEDGDWIVWTSQRYFHGASIMFRIEGYELSQEWQNRLQLREITASVFSAGDFIANAALADQPGALPSIGAPGGAAWELQAEMLDSGGPAIPILAITGAVDDSYARAIRVEYWRDDGVTDPEDVTNWITLGDHGAGVTRVEISTIASGADYYAAMSYVVGGIPGDRLILGPVTVGVITGTEGPPGPHGLSVAIVRIYKRSASLPTLPSATATLTFATGVVTGLNNGWTTNVPTSNGTPLYVSAATASGTGSTDTIGSGEWYTPTIEAQDGATGATGGTGAAGISTFPVRIYRRAAAGSPPTLPSATATVTFATGAITGLNNSWSASVPAADGNPLWVSVAAAIGTGSTDTIASGEWTTAVIEAQDGATGATGGTGSAGLSTAEVRIYKRAAAGTPPALPSATTTFTFATGGLTGLNNGWTRNVPTSDGNPLWVSQAAATGTGSTDTIASGEWATAVVEAQDGATGATGGTGAAGTSAATVSLFQRNTTGTPPSAPGSTTTYTFATGVLSGSLGSWAQADPGAASGAYLFTAQATALGTGSTDSIAAGEWTVRLTVQGLNSAQLASLAALVDDNVLTAAEKTARLLPAVAELGARYTYMAARAGALSVSTSAASTVRTAFLTYLAALSPVYDDTSQDTTLATASLASIILSAWGGSAVLGNSGLYSTVNDNSAVDYLDRETTFVTTPSNTYVFGVVVKKDAVAGATRAPSFRLGTPSASNFTDIRVDTSTGASDIPYNTAVGVAAGTAGVTAINDDEYLVWVSRTAAAGETNFMASIYPAASATGGAYDPAKTGTISVRDPMQALGTFDKLGRDAFRARLRDYSAALDALDKAVSEADVLAASTVITGLADIAIRYDNTGAAQAGELTRPETYKLVRNGSTVSSGLTWTYTIISGNVNGFTSASGAQSITGAGAVTLSVAALASDTATIQIKVVDANSVPFIKTVLLRRDTADAPVTGTTGGGTAASVSSFSQFSSTGMATVMPSGTAEFVVTASGTSVALTASLSTQHNASSATACQIYAIFQWWNGASWSDVGTETLSSPHAVRDQDADTGVWITVTRAQVNISTSKTGLTAGSSNRFRLMMRRHATNSVAGTYSTTGTAGAQG